MIIHTPVQVHDMIMMRLFTYDHNNLTRILSPLAMEWAKKRGIEVAIQKDRTQLFLVPDHMAEYVDWSRYEFGNPMVMDIFTNSLDMIQYAGWGTAKRRMRKFSMSEWHWIRIKFPDCYAWMKPQSHS